MSKPFNLHSTVLNYTNDEGLGFIQSLSDETVLRHAITRGEDGLEIYEGDVFREEKENENGDDRTYLVVTWIRQRGAFYLIPAPHVNVLDVNDCEGEDAFDWLFNEANLYDFSLDIGLPYVGNIYENPELLTNP